MFIMGNMALLWGGYGIFSDLLIVFRFPGLQKQYSGPNMPMTKGRICISSNLIQRIDFKLRCLLLQIEFLCWQMSQTTFAICHTH